MLKIRDSKNVWHEWKLGEDLDAATRAALEDVAAYGDEGAAFRISDAELALIGEAVIANTPDGIDEAVELESKPDSPSIAPSFAGQKLFIIQYYGSTPHPAYFQQTGQKATFEPTLALKFATVAQAKEFMLSNGLGQPWHAVPYQF